jgi:phenylacetate-CoA ligase
MFEPDMETMSIHEIENLQNKRLPHVVRMAYQHVTMYRDKFDKQGLPDIRGRQDLEKLPFTTKNDLRTYSFRDRLAVPEVELVRYLSTETTERSVVFGMTAQDLDVQAICCAKTFACATITREDTVLEIFPAGLFPIWVAQQGLQKLGAKIIHTLPGRTRELQIPILLGKFEAAIKPTAVTALASYLLRIAEVAQDEEIDPRAFGVNTLIVSSAMETLSDSKRRIIEDTYQASVYDVLGLVEVAGGPSIGGECEERNGLHLWENYFYSEVVDVDTHERVGPGEEGELVITSLENKTHPIIRYKTGIITKLLAEGKCGCGRTNIKISRSIGRADDILDVKGFLLDPKEIEDVLLSISGVGAEYRIIIRKIGGLDDILIITEMERARALNSFDQSIATDLLAKEIERTFKGTFNITPKVEIVPYDTMKRGNVTRFLDLRKPS